jgi:hypothetical protein
MLIFEVVIEKDIEIKHLRFGAMHGPCRRKSRDLMTTGGA